MPFKVYEDTDVDKFLLMSDVMGMEVLRSLSVVLHEKEEESEAEEEGSMSSNSQRKWKVLKKKFSERAGDTAGSQWGTGRNCVTLNVTPLAVSHVRPLVF